MQGAAPLLGNSGDGLAATGATEGGGGGGEVGLVGSNSGGFSEEDRGKEGGGGGGDAGGGGDMGERSSGGNRWPREETLALLKIRSDMEVTFRDSSLKGPLWEEVSRKLAELGYHRSAKKCKEKFENVYKYYKRTKEGRASKADGKTYRFFDQLEALDTLHHHHYPSVPPPPPPPQLLAPPAPSAVQPSPRAVTNSVNPPIPSQFTVPSAINPVNTVTTTSMNITVSPSNPLQPQAQSQPPRTMMNPPYVVHSGRASIPNVTANLFSSNSTSFTSSSSSSSTSSDETLEEGGEANLRRKSKRKRKRKWKGFFERLMRGVVSKQEELQREFLEAIERREHERMVREEAWRMQETARINREHEILVKERSIAAAKDAALISFLQKMSPSSSSSDIQKSNVSSFPGNTSSVPPPPQPQPPPPQKLPPVQAVITSTPTTMSIISRSMTTTMSTSRWPKAEIEALIRLRTEMDVKYQESGPKGPLWEEISGGMRVLGYERSSKRCKEKWENINKYFKKVKESNKIRPPDSKTCPYFHQLEALYREKNLIEGTHTSTPPPPNYGLTNPMAPLMVRPEQQWPPPFQDPLPADSAAEAVEEFRPKNIDHNLEDENNDDGDEEEEEREEDEGCGFVMEANNKEGSSMATAGSE